MIIMHEDSIIIELGESTFKVTDNGEDNTFTVKDLKTGQEHIGKFCTAHSEEEHARMRDAGIFC